MNESDYNELREESWRRKLSPSEEAQLQAWLGEHPDLHEDWELETNLSKAMSRLPDVPVPSNFTARVLQAVQRDAAEARPRVPAWKWFLHSLVPRAAVAVAVLGIGLFTYREYQQRTFQQQTQQAQRAQFAQDVKVVASVPSLPSPEILQDFDTIRKMGATPGPDPELIALMK